MYVGELISREPITCEYVRVCICMCITYISFFPHFIVYWGECSNLFELYGVLSAQLICNWQQRTTTTTKKEIKSHTHTYIPNSLRIVCVIATHEEKKTKTKTIKKTTKNEKQTNKHINNMHRIHMGPKSFGQHSNGSN